MKDKKCPKCGSSFSHRGYWGEGKTVVYECGTEEIPRYKLLFESANCLREQLVQARRKAFEEAAKIVKTTRYFNEPIMGVGDKERENLAACILHQIDKTTCPICGTNLYGKQGQALFSRLAQHAQQGGKGEK